MASPDNGRMNDKVKVSCTRCKTRFSERASRVREGYQGQCPACGCFINFTAEAMDPSIRRAMSEARRIRNGVTSDQPAPTSERV